MDIVLHVIKDCIWILGNAFENHMTNQILYFSILKHFNISTRTRKIMSTMQVFLALS